MLDYMHLMCCYSLHRVTQVGVQEFVCRAGLSVSAGLELLFEHLELVSAEPKFSQCTGSSELGFGDTSGAKFIVNCHEFSKTAARAISISCGREYGQRQLWMGSWVIH